MCVSRPDADVLQDLDGWGCLEQEEQTQEKRGRKTERAGVGLLGGRVDPTTDPKG